MWIISCFHKKTFTTPCIPLNIIKYAALTRGVKMIVDRKRPLVAVPPENKDVFIPANQDDIKTPSMLAADIQFVLMGLPGSGKTTVFNELKARGFKPAVVVYNPAIVNPNLFPPHCREKEIPLVGLKIDMSDYWERVCSTLRYSKYDALLKKPSANEREKAKRSRDLLNDMNGWYSFGADRTVPMSKITNETAERVLRSVYDYFGERPSRPGDAAANSFKKTYQSRVLMH